MKKILAIDDKEDNLTTIKAVLKSQMPDCTVLTALSGIDGVELAKTEQPDIILLDIIMPIIDGYETCKRLKTYELTKHIPVIMLTAIKTDMQSRVKALDLGADAFLSKPIDAVELIAQIKVMLRIKSAEDKLRAEKDLLEVIVFDRTKSLKESEQKYKTLYEFAPIPYQSLNEDGTIADINPAWLSLLGYEREDVIGQLYEDFIHPEDKPVLRKNFPVLVKSGFVHEVPFRLRHKKGHFLDISLEGRSGYNPDGSFKNTYCIFQDITERKKAERKLKESEEFKNRLIDSSYDCIKVLDTNGVLKSMSAGGQKLLEIEDISKYINKSWVEFWSGDDNGAALEAINKAKKGEIGEFRGFCKTEKGSPKWWDVIVTPINDEKGKLNSLLAISRDVTKQKQDQEKIRKSEERYKNFISQVSEGVFRIELSQPMPTTLAVEEQIEFMHDHLILAECNQTYLHMFGFTKQEEIIGKNPFDIIGGIAHADYRKWLRGFITSGYRSENMETTEQSQNGELKYF
ncbi:MAG: PAS domain S-box protein, partial [Bacteroidales bacterium]|nr:PAS domain S-box protein [Bacteroidales bacterium]